MFFYKKRWFNVIGQLKRDGIYYYCNMASPFILEEGAIKYIDYDLDLRVFPDWGYRILDRNEYNYHKKLLKYGKDLDFILRSELSALIDMKKKKEEPFNKEVIEYYYNIFKKISKRSCK